MGKRLLLIALLFLPAQAMADTLVLRDGRVFQGTYLGGGPDRVIFNVNGEVQEIYVSSLITMTFDSAAQRATPPAVAAPVNQASEPTMPKSVMVAAGTRVLARLDAPLTSNGSETGERFSGTLDVDIVAGGVVISKKGSKVYGRVVEATGAKRLAGKARLVIELTDLTINNQLQPVLSDKLGAQGADAAGGTAAKVGAGALIGAALDGKEGAGKGAAVGGGLALLTKGQQIQVPAGVLMEFRLQQGFTIGVK